MRPRVSLKAAISLDGYLDDTSAKRRVFSSKKDLESVDSLRAGVDAILVGAETLRNDNPRLRVKGAEAGQKQPLAVSMSRSALFESDLHFFQRNSLLFLPSTKQLSFKIPKHLEIVFSTEALTIEFVLSELSNRGVKHLLVEGGAGVLSQFWKSGCFDSLRLSVSGALLGSSGKAPLFLDMQGLAPGSLALSRVEELEGSAIHFYEFIRNLE